MADVRYGSQTPTSSVVIPYKATYGERAVERYEASGRTAQPWQRQLVYDIGAVDDDGLYTHARFGYQVPRRNGKGEILTIVENDDLWEGRHVLHTAHRATTSSSAALRLANILRDMGYTEVQRMKSGETYEKAYVYAKQFGLEKITLIDTGGTVSFRTRTATGGLGEGFDTLIIDEAQECTSDQLNALQYCVSDSDNPQIIFCGTPPTLVSKGTVFQKMRDDCLCGETEETGWAEWSVSFLSDVNDVDLWYECNPAMGYQLTERKVRNEDKSDALDFNIQRLGYWATGNLNSDISTEDWKRLKCETKPQIAKDRFIGVKYGQDGANVAVSVAVKTSDGHVFVESLDCQPARTGDRWIVDMINKIKPTSVVIDGKSGQDILADELAECGIKGIIRPKVSEVIVANSLFEKAVFDDTIRHFGQPALTQAATNCQKRAIGSGGGFGYRANKPGVEIALLDSVILAHWACMKAKEKRQQKINY